jgi:hypothetical protein
MVLKCLSVFYALIFTDCEKNPNVVEGWVIFSNEAFESWCVRALGWGVGWRGGVFHGKSLEAGIPSVICTFSNRASSVVMLGKAIWQGIMLWSLGSPPQVPQHKPLTGVPYPIRHLCPRDIGNILADWIESIK